MLVAEEVKAGRFTPKVEAFGLASGVVRYEPNPSLDSLVPAALKARVKAAADSIAAGTLIAAPRPTSMQAASPQRHRGHREQPDNVFSLLFSVSSVSSAPLW